MNDVHVIVILLDFYGQLLTPSQFEIMDLHYNNDYSLGEIAAHLNISRQGVYDHVKRSKILLFKYESKLGLAGKFENLKTGITEILALIKEINKENMLIADKERLLKILEITDKLRI